MNVNTLRIKQYISQNYEDARELLNLTTRQEIEQLKRENKPVWYYSLIDERYKLSDGVYSISKLARDMEVSTTLLAKEARGCMLDVKRDTNRRYDTMFTNTYLEI